MLLETTPVRAVAGMPDEVLSALHAAEAALFATPHPSPVHGTLAQWAEVVAVAQRVVNRAVAVQDEGMVALAAIEAEVLDDGTVVESHRAPGHVALDAPAIVSGALSVTSKHAEHRVRSAVRLAADGPTGSATATGLAGLHAAMRRGDLDAYRAGVVAEELEQAPPEVAAAVVQALETHADHETGPQLRSRCRRVLATISPDLVRQRVTRARERCSLRRWAEEPGVDKWEGTFPSEDAAHAWAAIDARAQQLRADGTCSRIERARAQALIDLVTGSATITTVVTLTVPAPPGQVPGQANGPGGPADPDPDHSPDSSAPDRSGGSTPHSPSDSSPGPTQGARGEGSAAPPLGGASRNERDGAAARTQSPEDLVEVAMGTRGERVLVTRAFLDVVTAGLGAQTYERPCHPASGALLDETTSSSYRPPPRMAALVRQRDGRCRFPGCHVAARFCDLDHVKPWPSGPTSPTNLVCLCRRHHRTKQRSRWSVRLAVDGQCTWTDPTGRVRMTSAIDALHTVVLPAPVGPGDSSSRESGERAGSDLGPESGSMTRYDLLGTSGRHSGLEFTLEHHAAAITTADLTRIARRRSAWLLTTDHRPCRAIDLHHPNDHRPRGDRFVLAPSWPGAPGHRTSSHRRRPDRAGESDDPPF